MRRPERRSSQGRITKWRASSGSVAPISVVGISSSTADPTKRTIDSSSQRSPSTRYIQWLNPGYALRISGMQQRVEADARLGERVGAHRVLDPVGEAAGQVRPQPEPAHERRQHRRDRQRRRPEHQPQLARPQALEDQPRRSGQEEAGEQNRAHGRTDFIRSPDARPAIRRRGPGRRELNRQRASIRSAALSTAASVCLRLAATSAAPRTRSASIWSRLACIRRS